MCDWQLLRRDWPFSRRLSCRLAFDSGNDMALFSMAIGAIFSDSILGDHCSPISDTTVMASIFAGSDHIAHVRTQIPYALVPASIS